MYNILQEKWIPVIGPGNRFEKTSLREVILRAQEYRELGETDSILECSLYRFLFTFVSDMVCSAYGGEEELEEIICELLREGAFPQEMFDHYLEVCGEDGVSFDIFDEKRPFMQNGEYVFEEGDTVSAAKLCPRAASGTNKLFQSHVAESDYQITFEEAAKYLLAYSPFNTPGGSGWGAGHFGAYPPVFTYVTGKSLFETILFNLIRNDGSDRPMSKPYWRTDMSNVSKGTEAPAFASYAAMQFPWRFVKLIPEDGFVRTMYYVPGYAIDKTRPDILPDPFATYLPGRKDGDRILFCAKESSIVWRNITGLFDLSSAPLVVRNYALLKESLDLDHISVVTYVTIVKDVHGTFTGAWKNEVSLPSEILDPSNTILEYMRIAITYAEKKCWSMHKAAEKAVGKEDYKSRKPLAETAFYSVCRNLFFNDFVPGLDESAIQALQKYQTAVTKTALDIYDKEIIESLSKMDDIRRAYEARRMLFDRKEG